LEDLQVGRNEKRELFEEFLSTFKLKNRVAETNEGQKREAKLPVIAVVEDGAEFSQSAKL